MRERRLGSREVAFWVGDDGALRVEHIPHVHLPRWLSGLAGEMIGGPREPVPTVMPRDEWHTEQEFSEQIEHPWVGNGQKVCNVSPDEYPKMRKAQLAYEKRKRARRRLEREELARQHVAFARGIKEALDHGTEMPGGWRILADNKTRS